MTTNTLPIGTLYGRNRAAMIAGPDGHVANLRPFRSGSAMRAELASYDVSELARWGRGHEIADYWHEHAGMERETVYVVWSYRTVIAAVLSDGTALASPSNFSQTTARHAGICRAWLPYGARKLAEELERFSIYPRADALVLSLAALAERNAR